MKYILTLIIFACLLPTAVTAQCVQVLNSNSSEHLNAVFFTQTTTGDYAGANATLSQSMNEWQTWTSQDTRTAQTLNSLYFSDVNTGWTVGNQGIIRHTTDSGNTWQQQYSPQRTNWHDIAFSDVGIGLIVGTCGSILRTTNNGTEWERVVSGSTNDLHSVHFVNSTVALVVGSGSTLLRTVDAGITWLPITWGGAADLYAVASYEDVVWIGGDGVVYKSIDAGQTWEMQSLTGNFESIAATGTDHAYFVGSGGEIQETRDGGLTFTDISLPVVTDDLHDVMFPDSTIGFAVGDNGTLLQINYFSADAEAIAPICAGETLNLTGTHDGTGASYNWINPQNSSVSMQQNPSLSTTTVAMSGLYTFEVIIDGCTETDTTSVLINPSPTASVSGDIILCTGESTELNASGGDSYLWEDNSMDAIRTVSPTTDTDYSVQVTNGFGCTDEAMVSVTVNALPTVTIESTELSGISDNDAVVCSGDPLTLTAMGGISYEWSPTETNASISLNPTVNESYSVLVTDANDCQNTQSINITVNENPTVEIQGELSFCAGDSTVLSIDGTFPTLQWSNAATTNAITVTSGDDYTVTVTDAAGCIAAAEETVIENPLPIVDISGAAAICPNEITSLNASPGFIDYTWSTGQQGVNSSLDISNSGIYQVTVTDVNDCAGTDIFEASSPLETIGVANAGDNIELCTEGDFQLSANLPAGASGLWSTTANLDVEDLTDPNSFIFDLTAGVYNFNWSLSSADCTDYSQAELTISVAASLVAIDDMAMGAFGEEITGNVLDNDNFAGEISVEIQTTPLPNGLTLVEDDEGWTGEWIFVAPSANETSADFNYQICSVECPDLCNTASFSAITPLEEGFVPEGFTPNGDGVNDQFVVPELEDPTAFPGNRIIIFNRWGDVVFEIENYRNQWEGEYQKTGASLPAGTYYYMLWLDVGEGEIREGYTVLIR